MIIFQVHHYIRVEAVATYKTAVLANAHKTLQEPGVLRFDVFQDQEDPTHFCLLEVYADEAAREAHLQTAHFADWKAVYQDTQARRGHGYHFTRLDP